MDLELIYDKIYRFAYFRLRSRELAEDITQETFLRHIEKCGSMVNCDMRYLYTIAKNLCIDEFRRIKEDPIPEGYEEAVEFPENKILTALVMRKALARLDMESQELLLLRHANEESVATISKLYKCSRFAMYRKLDKAEKKLKGALEEMKDE